MNYYTNRDGRLLWRTTFPGPVITPVSTLNGVVFALGDLVQAFAAAAGPPLSCRTDAFICGGIAIAGNTIFVCDVSGKLTRLRRSLLKLRLRRSPINRA